jgi:hypothetical protein
LEINLQNTREILHNITNFIRFHNRKQCFLIVHICGNGLWHMVAVGSVSGDKVMPVVVVVTVAIMVCVVPVVTVVTDSDDSGDSGDGGHRDPC